MNLVLGVFANLFNLLLNPQGWTNKLQASGISEDSTLLNISWRKLGSDRAIRDLLFQTQVVVPMLAGLITVVIVIIWGETDPYVLVFSLLLAVSYAFSNAFVTSLLINFGAAQVYGLSLGIGMGLLADDPTYIYFSYALSAGLVGQVLLNFSKQKNSKKLNRDYLISFISGIFIVGFLIAVWAFIFSGRVIREQFTQIGEREFLPGDIFLLFFFTLLIVTIVLYFAILFRNYGKNLNKRRLLVGAFVPGLLFALTGTGFMTFTPMTLWYVLVAGLGGGAMFAMLVSLPWIVFKHTKLNSAMIIASAFMVGLGWIVIGPLISIGFYFDQTLFSVAVLLVLTGLTFFHWFPFLAYPFILLFNYVLYVLDTQNQPSEFRLFQYHAVFWFEKVKFPWIGLDRYLTRMAESQPEKAYQKMLEITNTDQRWAVRQSLLELSYREMLTCNSLEEIAALKPAVIHIPDETLAFVNQFLRFSGDIKVALAYQSPYHIRAALMRVRDDLNMVERSLMMTSEKRLFRFLAVTAHWSTIINHVLGEMAAAQHDEDEIFNPYVCGIPLNENQELFVGRTEIFERIERLILNEQRPPLLLYGQRRMGKTSLLLNLGRILPNAIIPMYLDSQALGGVLDFSELFYGMVQQMTIAAHRYRNVILPKISLEQLKDSPFLTFLEWIIELDIYLLKDNKIALWLIDEFETLNHWGEMKSANIQELLNLFRYIVQHHSNIKILFSGTHHLSEMESWAGSLVNTQVIKVGCLKPDEAEALIQTPAKNFNLVYPRFALDWILNLTGGHPHLIQLFCYELIIIKNEQPLPLRIQIMPDDLEEAYQRATLGGEFFFIDIYQNQIRPEMKPAFEYLAKNSNGSKGLPYEIWQKAFQGNLDKVISVGLQRELIQKDPEGYYVYKIEWIRRWFMERSHQ